MVSNHEIARLFNLYAELLLLHQKDEKLAATLLATPQKEAFPA